MGMRIANRGDNIVTVDLESQTVIADGFSTSFDVDTFAKHSLLNGLDRIGVTLTHGSDIDRYESERPTAAPPIT